MEELLALAGADMILKEYEENSEGDRIVVGFTFTIKVNDVSMMFKLPSDTAKFADAMLADIKRAHKGTRARIVEQANRTAWRVLKDWMEIQLTMIRVHQVHPFKIFMGYLYDPRSKETLFEVAERTGFQKLLTAGNK
jgi:hypothetical protein